MVSDLHKEVEEALKNGRPIIHHLNADTTWLIQLPIPQSSLGTTSNSADPSSSSSSNDRKWFYILLDPWLSGPQADVAAWFSKQWHAIPPALASIEEVQALIDKVEDITAQLQFDNDATGSNELASSSKRPAKGQIDVITVSHEFTDHCHKITLLQCPPTTAVFAATKAVPIIKSWNHFKTVIETPSFASGNWKSTSIDPLPKWVGIGRVMKPGDAFYYHSAIAITFDLGQDPSSGTETIIYTPHGIRPEALDILWSSKAAGETNGAEKKTGAKVLACLHGLHDVSIDWGQQLNLGAQNGLAVQRKMQSKYWIGTHDEIKNGGGVVSWFLRRKVWSVNEALEREGETGKKIVQRSEESDSVTDSNTDSSQKPVDVGSGGVYLEMLNGESMVLK